MKQQSLGARFGLTGKVGAVLPVLPPWLALVEIALLLVAPILLQFAWPAFPDLTTYNPHPYWGPVLLLSLQYGTVSGVLSAIVAIAGMVLIGLPEPDIGENHFAYLIRVWTQPVLWIATALLLGHFRMHQIEQRDELMRRVDDLTNSSSALADHATNLRARCDQLERRIAVRAISASDQTLEHLAAIARSRPADMAHHFDALVRAALPGGVASLYARDAGGLSLVAKSGWSADAPWAVKIGDGESLAVAMTEVRRPLSVLEAGDEVTLAGQGLAAIPLMTADGSAVCGMLKIERLPPMALTAATVRRLGALTGPLASALANRAVAGSAKSEVPAPDAGEASGVPAIRRWRQMRWFAGSRATEPANSDAPPAKMTPTVVGR